MSFLDYKSTMEKIIETETLKIRKAIDQAAEEKEMQALAIPEKGTDGVKLLPEGESAEAILEKQENQ